MIKSVFDIGGLLMSKKGEKKNPIQKTHAFDFVIFFYKQKIIKFFEQKKKTKRISNNRKYIIHRLPKMTDHIFCEDFSHEPSLDEMRRGLTLPTRQLNASHDAEILFYEKHTDLEVFLGLLSIVLCVFSYNFIVIIHLFFTNFAENNFHSILHRITSKNIMPRHLFLAPLFPFFQKGIEELLQKERKGKERKEKGREGKGRERKGKEGKGRKRREENNEFRKGRNKKKTKKKKKKRNKEMKRNKKGKGKGKEKEKRRKKRRERERRREKKERNKREGKEIKKQRSTPKNTTPWRTHNDNSTTTQPQEKKKKKKKKKKKGK